MTTGAVGKKRTPGQEAAAIARREAKVHEGERDAAKARAAAAVSASADSYAKTAKRARKPEVSREVKQVLAGVEAIMRQEPDLESPLWAGIKGAFRAGKALFAEDRKEAEAEGKRKYRTEMADKLETLPELPAHKGRGGV